MTRADWSAYRARLQCRAAATMWVLICWLAIGVGSAWVYKPVNAQQSQEYINGLVEGQLRSFAQRLDRMEYLLYFVVTTTVGGLITQGIGFRNQRNESRGRSERETEEDDPRPRRRYVER